VARAVRTGSQLDVGLLLACMVLSALALFMPARFRDTVAASVRRTVLAPMVTMQQHAEVVRATIVARDTVEARAAQITGTRLDAPALQAENVQLRQILGLGTRLGHGFVAAEALHADNFDSDFTLTVSAGSNAGVERFTPVVTADGILGMVDRVDATMSFAISWAHPDFRVSAMSVDGSAYGIVQPHLGTGAERWLLEIRNVAFRSPLKNGTLIVSSGLGKGYPRGIPVGTVLGEVQTTDKWARTYLIKPAVLPNAIGPVLLLIPSRSEKDVNGVWTTLASADSAAKAIVTAGDSIARKAALAELAARKAALDSVALTDSTLLDLPEGALPSAGTPRPDSLKRPVVRDTTRKPVRVDSTKPKPVTGPPPALEPSDVAGPDDYVARTAVLWP
jgi:rod shape-determining protein MreC